MKLVEKNLIEKNHNGWVCGEVDNNYKVYEIDNLESGFVEVEIGGFTTPLGEDDFKKPLPEIKHRKIHLFSIWSAKVFDQNKDAYKKNGHFNAVLRAGKYPSFKAKAMGNNQLHEDQIIVPGAIDGKLHTYRIEWKEGVVKYFFDGELMKLRNGKMAVFNIPGFKIKYVLLGRDNRYGNPCNKAMFYGLKIGIWVEEEIEPIDPPPVDPPPVDPPKDDDTLGTIFKKIWDNFNSDVKKIIIFIAVVLFLLLIFFGF